MGKLGTIEKLALLPGVRVWFCWPIISALADDYMQFVVLTHLYSITNTNHDSKARDIRKWSYTMTFLDATTYLYKRSCPFVRRSVYPSDNPPRVIFERRKTLYMRVKSHQITLWIIECKQWYRVIKSDWNEFYFYHWKMVRDKKLRSFSLKS